MCDRDKETAAHYERFVNHATGHAAGRQMDGATFTPELKFAEASTFKSMQYTPLLVTMMLEMYAIPDRRAYYLYSSVIDPSQREVLELLKRAKIVVPAITPPLIGAAQMWNVDENALRVYVNAVCSVPLPDMRWVMP